MKAIVTDFDSFGGETINPASGAVKKLSAEIAGAEIIKVGAPTVFGTNGEEVAKTIETHQPDIMACVGQIGDHKVITVEKVTISLAEARIPDNTGQQPGDIPLIKDGVATYLTNLPIKAMVGSRYDHQLPAAISYAAGAFICNDTVYRSLHLVNIKYPTVRSGLVRIPFLPGQTTDKPAFTSMSLRIIIDSLLCMIETAAKTQEDI